MKRCIVILAVVAYMLPSLAFADAGYALQFDGVNDFVQVPYNSSLEPANSLTIEAWLDPTGYDSYVSVPIVLKQGDHNNPYGLYVYSSRNDLAFILTTEAGRVNIFVDIDPYLNGWIHMAGVYDGSFMKLYVNGNVVDSSEHTGNINYYSHANLHIGEDEGHYWHSQIDELRVWDIARTGDEIAAAMHSSLNGDEEGLVGYWRLDEGSGDIASDSSPYGNDGQLGTLNGPDGSDPTWVVSTVPFYRTWHVSVDGDDVNGDGSEENPFATIQHGIDMASDGDTVLVWPGTYTGEGNRSISPEGKSIIIKSAFGAESTIIDVEGHPYGFYFVYPPENSNTIVNGFTINNAYCGFWLTGSYNELQGLNISNCTTGLMCNASSSTILDCEFSNNIKGIDWEGFNFTFILRCFFIDNEIGVWRHRQGSCQGDQSPIDSCTFEGNSIAIQSCCMLSNSIIRDGEYGIYVPWPMDAILSNCILENIYGIVLNAGSPADKRDMPDSIRERISMEYYGPGFAVFNSIIRNNPGQVAVVGTDYREDVRTLILNNCQIYGNGGGIGGNGKLTIANCDYMDNAAGIDFSPTGNINISGSSFQNNNDDALNIFGWLDNIFGVNIEKSIFANNRGRGMYIDVGYSEEFIINGCTFAQNDDGGITVQGFYNSDSLKIDNSIMMDNGSFGIEVLDSPECILVSYCDNYGNSGGNYFGLPDQTGQNGNISEDPLFIDPDNGNYQLQCASPCVDTGDPDVFDPDGTRSDMGAFYLPHYYTPTETGIIAPPNGSVADSLTWLTWLESTDEDTSCNIVSYRLQIDEDPNFESPEVNVDTLPASGPLLEETISYRILSLPGWLNLLVDSTYFWRVGSVDEIGDTSAWTPGPNYFIYTFPTPVPTLSEWGMIILGLLLLATGTVAVIRRRKEAFANER